MKGRSERGAATVELALSIPLLVVMMLLLVQVAGVMLTQLAVQEAARAGARVAAVDPQPGAAAAAAKAATGLNPRKLQVSTLKNDPHGFVRVRVSFPAAVRMPLSNAVLITPRVQSEVAMPLETAS